MYICFHESQEETVVIVTPLVLLHLSTEVKKKRPSEVHKNTLLDF